MPAILVVAHSSPSGEVTFASTSIMHYNFEYVPKLTLSFLLQIASDLLQSSSCSSRDNTFEERFKYDIISSSLLSSSLAAPTITPRPSLTPDIPGKLDGGGGSMGDPHSPSDSNPDFQSPDPTTTSNSNPSGPELSIALLSIAVVFLSAGFILLAVVFIASAIYVRYVVQADRSTSDSLSQVSCPPSLSPFRGC